jgi:hypothetical protein
MIGRGALRLFRRSFGGRPISENAFHRVDTQFSRARLIVKAYYLLSIYFSASTIPQMHDMAGATGAWLYLWPVRWIGHASNAATIIDWLCFAWLLTSLAAFAFTQSRIIRTLFACAMLEVAAVSNSLGGINHGFHAWFWVGFLLIFLPARMEAAPSRSGKMAYLSVIAGCQTLLLSFYTLAGFQKFAAGIHSVDHGALGNFSSFGLASTIADRMVQTGTTPLLGRAMVDYPWLSLPLFLPIIFIQMMAVIVAFRPRLHPVWGWALIAFHVGTWLLMEILFIQHVALLALFLVASPFTPDRMAWRDALADIPVIGPLANLLPRRRAGPALEPELPPAE